MLARLERSRLAALAWRRLGLALIAMLAGAAASAGTAPFTRPATLLLGAAGAVIFWRCMNRRFSCAFKQEIVPALLAATDPALRYRLAGRVAQNTFEASDLFPRPDRYTGQDLVQGHIGDTALEFSFVHARQRCMRSYTDMYGNTHTQVHYRSLFRGLFLSADFNKHFSGYILLRPRPDGLLGSLSSSNVLLEDPEFGRLFTVTATDQVEARYVLSPTLMGRLKALRAKLGPFHAAFSAGNLFIALGMPADAFALSLSRPLNGAGQVDQLRSNLAAVTGIVADLGLNIRIWSKAGMREPDSAGAGG